MRANSCTGVRPAVLGNRGSAPSLIRHDIIGKSCLCTARCRTLQVPRGREGGREGGREREREGGREGGERERGREGGRRERGREGGREGSSVGERGREGGRDGV